MARTMRFQPVAIDGPLMVNPRQEACLIKLADKNGNVVELAMTAEFGAKLVSETRSAFLALDQRKMEEGITADQRQEFGSKAAQLAMRINAEMDRPRLDQKPGVLVTVAQASTYEQSFSLPVEWAEDLAAELQTAIRQARQNQG